MIIQSGKPDLSTLYVLRGLWRRNPRYSGCIGHWIFNERGGLRVHDASGFGRGLDALLSAPDWGVHQGRQSMDFDGTSDYLDLPGLNTIDVSPPYTMLATIYPRDLLIGVASKGVLFGNRDNDNNYIRLRTNSIDIVAGGTSRNASTEPDFGNNAWQHFAVRVDSAGNVVFYRNAVECGSPASTLTSTFSVSSVFRKDVGGSGDLVFGGKCEELRIYKRLLTRREIDSHYRDPWAEFRWAWQVWNGFFFPLTSGAAPQQATFTEGAKAGDTFAAVATLLASITEGVKAGDSWQTILTAAASFAEGANLGDAWVGGLTTAAQITDGAKVGDAWAADVLTIIEASFTEGSSLGDTFAALLQATPAFAEGSALGDAFAGQLTLQSAITEGMDAGDVWAAALVAVAQIAEGFLAGDAWAADVITGIPADFAEGFLASDAFQALLDALAQLAEGAELGDAWAAEGGQDLAETVNVGGWMRRRDIEFWRRYGTTQPLLLDRDDDGELVAPVAVTARRRGVDDALDAEFDAVVAELDAREPVGVLLDEVRRANLSLARRRRQREEEAMMVLFATMIATDIL